MKELIANEIAKITKIKKEEIESILETPPSPELGDYSFPCFSLAKSLKKNPIEIAKELSLKIKSKDLEKVEAKGPYLNFFLNKDKFTSETLRKILKEREKYGSSSIGKKKTITIDLSAPNIAKPFGIGHLRSTIIGNSISNICKCLGYKTVKINYLGDWGTQFGKLIVAYKKFGDEKSLKKDPIKYLLDLYIKGNDEQYESEAREWFKKLESGDKNAILLWKKFKDLSLKEFEKIYSLLEVKFDVTSGESFYNNKMDSVVNDLEKKGFLEESEGAKIVNLEKLGMGVCLIKKSDGATLYATRDLAAAIDRYKKYKFSKMIYEVGQEQKLHFQQVFKILELLGYPWAKDCIHVYHGLYLDKDGKKFATREGKTVFMSEVIDETISIAKSEILKREKLSEKELEERAKKIALSAIIYGDLKNYRANDIVFDIERFLSFEGNTGPYLLYTYARAKSILRKAKYKQTTSFDAKSISQKEKEVISQLSAFPDIVIQAYKSLSPNLIANYAFQLAQSFNEYYHSEQVIGSEKEKFKLVLVDSFSQVLKNSLHLLGIRTLEKM